LELVGKSKRYIYYTKISTLRSQLSDLPKKSDPLRHT
jgi:hypothetical protein